MYYPVFIDGEERGELRMDKSGLYTLMRVCAQGSGLQRIWLHGAGECGYLGIMRDTGEGLLLERKFTRRELAALPENIEYASNSALPIGGGEQEPECAPEETADKAEDDAEADMAPTERVWHRATKGVLVSHENGFSLVALPCELRKKIRGADIRQIDGREYMIFYY